MESLLRLAFHRFHYWEIWPYAVIFGRTEFNCNKDSAEVMTCSSVTRYEAAQQYRSQLYQVKRWVRVYQFGSFRRELVGRQNRAFLHHHVNK